MVIFRILIVFLSAIALVSCGSIQPSTQDSNLLSPTDTVSTQKQNTATPKISSPSDKNEGEPTKMPPSSTGIQHLVEQAKEDLAQRLSISVSQISFVKATEVVWPDASLGCPQPDMLYKQVPEDGALIVLKAQRKTFEYHSGGTRGLFLCETPPTKTEKPPQIDITKLTPQSPAGKSATPAMPDNSIPPSEDQ